PQRRLTPPPSLLLCPPPPPPPPRPPPFPYTTLFRSPAVRPAGTCPAARLPATAPWANSWARPARLAPTATRPPYLNVSSSPPPTDRKSTRLNSSHVSISYAVFCLKKKNDGNLSADGR